MRLRSVFLAAAVAFGAFVSAAQAQFTTTPPYLTGSTICNRAPVAGEAQRGATSFLNCRGASGSGYGVDALVGQLATGQYADDSVALNKLHPDVRAMLGGGGTTVVANPGGTGNAPLTSITIGTTDYDIQGGGSAISLTDETTQLTTGLTALTFTGAGSDLHRGGCGVVRDTGVRVARRSVPSPARPSGPEHSRPRRPATRCWNCRKP